jgi:hypothetical protein
MSNLSIVALKPEQYSQWDAFVEQSPQGDVFCYSWWLEAITNSHFKILVSIEQEEIVAGIPIAFDELNKVNEPPVTRTLGVLYKPQEHLPEHKQISNQRKWLSALLEQFPLEDFVQMCTHHNFTDWLPFRWKGFKQTTRYTYITDFRNNNTDKLWKSLSRLQKRMVNKALENGIGVEETDDFALLYHFECLSYERQGLKFRIPFENLKFLDDAIKKNGNRSIFKAIDKSGKVHAMLYVAFNKRSAYALLSGSDPELRNMGGHTLVTWEAIKFFCNKVTFYNFGGSDIELIEKHLRGFGGTLTPYFHIYNGNLIWKRNDIRHHLSETSFHIKEVIKIVKKKIINTLQRK